eukprot:Rmarinus@m.2787
MRTSSPSYTPPTHLPYTTFKPIVSLKPCTHVCHLSFVYLFFYVEDAGEEDNKLIITMFIVGLWNFLSVFASLPFVDKVGRKPLMVLALWLMLLGHVLMAVMFLAVDEDDRIGMAIPAICIFIFGFEIGPGPLFYVLASEMFPEDIREAALAYSNAWLWCFNLLVSLLFPVSADAFGGAAAFSFFAIMTAAAIWFVRTFVEETKDVVIATEVKKPLLDPTL